MESIPFVGWLEHLLKDNAVSKQDADNFSSLAISTRAQVAQVAACADGVVVGSALVNVVRDGLGDRAGIGAALARKVSDLAAGTARK